MMHAANRAKGTGIHRPTPGRGVESGLDDSPFELSPDQRDRGPAPGLLHLVRKLLRNPVGERIGHLEYVRVDRVVGVHILGFTQWTENCDA